jgi:hypothetical protein
MSNSLSKAAIGKLLSLKKAARNYLVSYKTLKGTPAYAQNKAKYEAVRDLFSELNLLDLSAPAAAPQTEEKQPKKKKSSKEERKARRAARKAARKAKKEKSARDKRKEKRQEKKAMPFSEDESGAKTEAFNRFEELKGLWSVVSTFENITEGFKNAVTKSEEFITKAQDYIHIAKMFATGEFADEVARAEEWVAKAKKYIAIAKNVTDQVERYNKIFLAVVDITGKIPTTVENLKDGFVKDATEIFASARQFLAIADSEKGEFDLTKLQDVLTRGQEKLDQLGDLVGLIIKDEDKNNLPDWFDKLQAEYDKLLGTTDLIPGMDLDDKVLLQIKNLNTKLKDFVAAASQKIEDLDIQGKIDQAKTWLKETSEFVTAITGFVENVKDGDLIEIYQDLKDFKSYLDSNPDIFSQTQLDNKLLQTLSDKSKKAEQWLMNKLTGGDATKVALVKAVLGSIDTLILSSGNPVNHTPKYEQDANAINIPDITALTAAQKATILGEHGINPSQTGIPYDRVLGNVIIQALRKKGTVTSKYEDFLKVGAEASKELIDAREQFDGAVEAHDKYIKAINTIGIKAIGAVVGLAANMMAPGVGSVVKALGGALLGDMSLLNDKIDALIPVGVPIVGDLAKGISSEILPKFGSEEGIINIDGESVMNGLADLYANGITAKYAEVFSLLVQIEGSSDIIQKKLVQIGQAGLGDEAEINDINKDILLLAYQWNMLTKQIQQKYLDLQRPSVNTRAAFYNASRYFHSIWLIKFPKKEIRIGKTMIKEFNTFGIIKESGAEWKSGFWSQAGRGFFGFFGADPFDYRAELDKMKKWSYSEQSILKTPAAWKRNF